MKQGWEIKSLGELAEIKGGKRVPKGYRLETEPTNYPYIRVTDFNDNGSVDLNDIHYINEEVFKQIKNYTISTNDLYISIAGTIGKTGIIPEELDGSNLTENACKLVFKKDVESKFVYYFTKSDDFLKQAGLNTRIAAMPKLALTRLSTISLLFPKSLPEQQRIVILLDKAFTAIAKAKENAEQNLKNAKEFFESYLQSVFANKGEGWEEKFIKEICDLITGGTPSSNKNEYYEGGEIRWLVSGDVNMGEIHDCEGRITELGLLNSNAKYLPLNSVVIALNGQGKTRGTVAMLRTKATCNQSLVSIYPKDIQKIIPEYIFYNFKVRYQEIRKITGDSGNDRRGLNMPLIRNIKISYPKSIIKQKEYIEVFSTLSSECNKLEANYQKKIEDLEELKKSILQKEFNGELKTTKAVPI
jgi:type I restriction enzyme S subunit